MSSRIKSATTNRGAVKASTNVASNTDYVQFGSGIVISGNSTITTTADPLIKRALTDVSVVRDRLVNSINRTETVGNRLLGANHSEESYGEDASGVNVDPGSVMSLLDRLNDLFYLLNELDDNITRLEQL